MRGLALAIVAVLMGGSASQAQTRISAEDFLAAAQGKTMDFHDLHTGRLVGQETFLRDDLSIWKPAGQGCFYGEIYVQDGKLCFLYRDLRPTPACWYTFEQDGRLIVRHERLARPDIQEVRKISETPLNCENAPTS